jgi:predicted nucleic acid-binding protein
MNGVVVDSNVILDIFEDDPTWADWAEQTLEEYGQRCPLFINSIIYSEISMAFARIEELEASLSGCGFSLILIPKEALFLAGKAFLRYRRKGGTKRSPLPDFFIGAHAAVSGLPLITRDTSRITTYFPTVHLISPSS